jgi:hypothetical protein
MDLKPQSFFIGVVDFFSVWIPGAILAWFLKVQYFDQYAYLKQYLQLPADNAAVVAAFLIITYILGSIVFGISTLLDPLYDKTLRNLFMPKDRDRLEVEVKTVTAIRESFINSKKWIEDLYRQGKLTLKQYEQCRQKDRPILYSYKWVQHYFLFKFPDALQDIKRVEADSKFFRSLVLAFVVMSASSFVSGQWITGLLMLAFSLLSLYLYSTNRYKATIRAYELMITHYHMK